MRMTSWRNPKKWEKVKKKMNIVKKESELKFLREAIAKYEERSQKFTT